MENDEYDNYANRVVEDRELARRLDLKHFEDALAKMTPDDREKKFLLVGAKEYSFQDIYEEVYKESDVAEMFRSIMRNVRLAESVGIKR